MIPSAPLVTIAIPTHNRVQNYLPQALACAVRQTYRNIEIIVSDNCSTDGTPQFMASQTDRRIRYYRHDTAMAPNDNFNFCLGRARGKYFLLLLDDELIDAAFVESCTQAVGNREDCVGLIRTGIRAIDANGERLYEVPNHANGLGPADFFLAWFSGATALYLCNTLFRVEMLRSVGGFVSRHNLFQDVMAQVRVMSSSSRIDVPDVLASTRSHPGQYTYSARVVAWIEDSLDLLALIENAVPQRKEEIARRGEKFFAAVCYSRAATVQPGWQRLRAYETVYHRFGRRHYPPLRTLLQGTTTYRWLRSIKRYLKGQPQWAAAG